MAKRKKSGGSGSGRNGGSSSAGGVSPAPLASPSPSPATAPAAPAPAAPTPAPAPAAPSSAQSGSSGGGSSTNVGTVTLDAVVTGGAAVHALNNLLKATLDYIVKQNAEKAKQKEIEKLTQGDREKVAKAQMNIVKGVFLGNFWLKQARKLWRDIRGEITGSEKMLVRMGQYTAQTGTSIGTFIGGGIEMARFGGNAMSIASTTQNLERASANMMMGEDLGKIERLAKLSAISGQRFAWRPGMDKLEITDQFARMFPKMTSVRDRQYAMQMLEAMGIDPTMFRAFQRGENPLRYKAMYETRKEDMRAAEDLARSTAHLDASQEHFAREFNTATASLRIALKSLEVTMLDKASGFLFGDNGEGVVSRFITGVMDKRQYTESIKTSDAMAADIKEKAIRRESPVEKENLAKLAQSIYHVKNEDGSSEDVTLEHTVSPNLAKTVGKDTISGDAKMKNGETLDARMRREAEDAAMRDLMGIKDISDTVAGAKLEKAAQYTMLGGGAASLAAAGGIGLLSHAGPVLTAATAGAAAGSAASAGGGAAGGVGPLVANAMQQGAHATGEFVGQHSVGLSTIAGTGITGTLWSWIEGQRNDWADIGSAESLRPAGAYGTNLDLLYNSLFASAAEDGSTVEDIRKRMKKIHDEQYGPDRKETEGMKKLREQYETIDGGKTPLELRAEEWSKKYGKEIPLGRIADKDRRDTGRDLAVRDPEQWMRNVTREEGGDSAKIAKRFKDMQYDLTHGRLEDSGAGAISTYYTGATAPKFVVTTEESAAAEKLKAAGKKKIVVDSSSPFGSITHSEFPGIEKIKGEAAKEVQVPAAAHIGGKEDWIAGAKAMYPFLSSQYLDFGMPEPEPKYNKAAALAELQEKKVDERQEQMEDAKTRLNESGIDLKKSVEISVTFNGGDSMKVPDDGGSVSTYDSSTGAIVSVSGR